MAKIPSLDDLLHKQGMHRSDPIIPFLVNESSNKLREFFGLSASDLMPGPMPKIVTRKDLSLDNYFAELLLRSCYSSSKKISDFEEIIIRGDNIQLPTELNPQIKGAILIGIGGQSNNRDFIRAYDEHKGLDGTRSVDSASQVVYFAHLNKYRRLKPGVHKILGILNPLNAVDAEGDASENHLIHMAKKLHFAQFQSPGYVVEGFSPQLKRAVINAILSALCVSIDDLRNIDMQQAGEDLREAWKLYRERRNLAVEHERLMPISTNTFGTVVNRTTSPNPEQISNDPNLEVRKKINGSLHKVKIGLGTEQRHPFSLRRIWYALDKVWGKELGFFVVGFLLEAMLQLQEEFDRGLTIPLDETKVPGTDYYIYYYLMSASDMQPHRAILKRVNKDKKKGLVIVKDSRRQIMCIFKTKEVAEEDWVAFLNWLHRREPQRWYRPYNEKKKRHAPFVLNGARYQLGSEPSDLTKEKIAEGLTTLNLN